MFKNIAKRIQLLAVILAIFLLVSFLALAAFFLVAMLGTSDPDLRAAGMQGLIVSVILAATGTMNVIHAVLAGIFLLIGMILLFMGIMGMYLARVYDEAKGRPEYILKNTERK